MSNTSEKPKSGRGGRTSSTKQVRLRLVYVDFWSLTKLSFLVWFCLGIVLVVATVLVWIVLESTGIFGTIDELFSDILGEENFTILNSFGFNQVATFVSVIAVLNLAVGTILGAIAALIYNLTVRITGGIMLGFQNN